MSGRKNLFLVGGILLAAILLFLVQTLFRPRPNGEVMITVDGKEYARVSLGKPQEILIDCGNDQ
ncbi:MAG: NusG domain II-containing protein, partial [Clostridiales bacterium]|nr:NusG domain II-containing protein [Clostridiales bacterium]